MFNTRLIITPKDYHFAQWEIPELRKHFKAVIEVKLPHRFLKKDDILLCYGYPRIEEYANAKCRAKFGMVYPAVGIRPWHPDLQDHLRIRRISSTLEKYNALFANEGPVWEKMRTHCPNMFLVPFSADGGLFKKTRIRTKFVRIIQVARQAIFKGREISYAAMQLMPYNWELYPPQGRYHKEYTVTWLDLVKIYQDADGFLSPNIIGRPPKYDVDAKYNQATMEAGLSGCLIFWHDCMNIGNSFETVFEISTDPKEIAQKIQDVVGSIDLDKHSITTAQEFYEKCNAENAVRVKVGIMKRFCEL
jgi:hypothetical protein